MNQAQIKDYSLKHTYVQRKQFLISYIDSFSRATDNMKLWFYLLGRYQSSIKKSRNKIINSEINFLINKVLNSYVSI